MALHPLAGKPAPRSILVNVPRLVAAYYTRHPDVRLAAHNVSFGTSGHRGTSFKNNFNEDHILAIAQAICDYRRANGITGTLFLGMDTHALSQPAHGSAIEVLAGNGVPICFASHGDYTPTPVISHAILVANRGKSSGLADGVVITPSHNPPEDGGFKYNPPHGGPADANVTRWIEQRASELLRGDNQGVRRMPLEKAMRQSNVQELDEALALKRGLVFVTAHFGAVEFLPLLLALKGYPVTMVVRFKSEQLKQAQQQRAEEVGVRLLDPADGPSVVFAALQALKTNRILITECDEFTAWRPRAHRFVSFLGFPCPMDRTLDLLHRRHQSPVVMGLACRDGKDRYRLPLHALVGSGEESVAEDIGLRALSVLERYRRPFFALPKLIKQGKLMGSCRFGQGGPDNSGQAGQGQGVIHQGPRRFSSDAGMAA